MTRFGCTQMRTTNFLCRSLNPSTARRDQEGEIPSNASCIVRKIPEPCVLRVPVKVHTQKTMQNHTSIIGCTAVKNGERAVFTTFDDGIDLHCFPFTHPAPIVVSDGKTGTAMKKIIAQKNQGAFFYASTGT